jgi:hypothetical protein
MLHVVPIASVEIPINLATFTTIDEAYDANFDCLLVELINSSEYRTLFKYCFPLETLLSLATIYVIETFLLSIGREWQKANGLSRPAGRNGSQFKRWDKTANFEKTKKNLRRLFEGFYHSRDATYIDEEEETNAQKTRKRLRIKKKLPINKDFPWWRKRMRRPKPCD